MKKVEGFSGKADKQSGCGQIVYEIWVDEHGELFVKFKDNEIDTDHPGTFSTVLFSVLKYAEQRNSQEKIGRPTGIDETTGKGVTPADNNNGAFLKAVLRDLLP